MKNSFSQLFLALVLTGLSVAPMAHAESLAEFLEPKEIATRFREKMADLDMDVRVDLGNVDLATGINIAAKYRYNVESSYQAQYYTRVDKWDLKGDINVGDIIENFVDLPFSFSVRRENSFLFARQFKNKKEALKAKPYTPKKLPLSAEAALNNLEIGDFVSMPANLNIAFEANASTAYVNPVAVNAAAKAFFIMSGEFTVQVFKVDDSHVRLKLFSKRGYDRGAQAGLEVSFKLFGVNVVDHQIDRLFDRDLIKYGYTYSPGSQFTVDYVFDLTDVDSQKAYNQILKTTLKFKDLIVLNKLGDAGGLKDKLISTFEKADKIFEIDKTKAIKDRRISRIFKGFNDYEGHSNKLKISALLASYSKDRAYTENKITFTDKNENNLEFFYPTYSKFMESKFWKGILKDQSLQNNFGLIPHLSGEDSKTKDPDYGLTFERNDKLMTTTEQKMIEKFMVGQVPAVFGPEINIEQWKTASTKKDARVFLKLMIKSQGFVFLKTYSLEELQKRLNNYVLEKKELQVLDYADTPLEKLKEFLFVNRFIQEGRLNEMAREIYDILKNENHDSEEMLRRLVKLNEKGIFDKVGVGFLISLLPQQNLIDLIYLKVEMSARDLKNVKFEFGTSNYRTLYKELDEAQARISGRSYDLRVTELDHEMEETDIHDDPSIISELFPRLK